MVTCSSFYENNEVKDKIKKYPLQLVFDVESCSESDKEILKRTEQGTNDFTFYGDTKEELIQFSIRYRENAKRTEDFIGIRVPIPPKYKISNNPYYEKDISHN